MGPRVPGGPEPPGPPPTAVSRLPSVSSCPLQAPQSPCRSSAALRSPPSEGPSPRLPLPPPLHVAAAPHLSHATVSNPRPPLASISAPAPLLLGLPAQCALATCRRPAPCPSGPSHSGTCRPLPLPGHRAWRTVGLSRRTNGCPKPLHSGAELRTTQASVPQAWEGKWGGYRSQRVGGDSFGGVVATPTHAGLFMPLSSAPPTPSLISWSWHQTGQCLLGGPLPVPSAGGSGGAGTRRGLTSVSGHATALPLNASRSHQRSWFCP